jgi:hypothetical protein
MDHNYIEEFDIVERYLARRLAEGETAEFEEHFVDCSECVGRLETTKAFADGLRRVASDRAKAAPDRPNEILRNERSTVPRKAFAVAAGALSVIIIAAAVLAFAQVRRYRADADRARSASTEWERRYDNVQVDLPIFALASTRGGDAPSGPANELTIPRSSPTFAITLSLEGELGHRSYVMTIVNSQKESIWKGRVKVNRDNAISVGFNSTLFHPGDYFLTLDGVTRDGAISIVGKYSFRVRKPPS